MINIKYKFCLTRLHEHLELDSYHISAISEGGIWVLEILKQVEMMRVLTY